MPSEIRTPVHEETEFKRFLRVLWRAANLFVVALEKEFKLRDSNRKLK